MSADVRQAVGGDIRRNNENSSSSNLRTLDCEAATIRFTGGTTASSSSSETDSDFEDSSSPSIINKSSQNVSKVKTTLKKKCNNVMHNNNDSCPGSSQPVNEQLNGAKLEREVIVNCDESGECINQIANDGSSISDVQHRLGENGNVEDSQSPSVCQFNPFDKVPFEESDDFGPITRGKLNSISTESWDSIPTPNGEKSEEDMGLAENHFSPPEDTLIPSTVPELEMAISHYKQLVMEAPEHTEQRRELVQKLVDLRIKLADAKEEKVISAEDEECRCVVGHRFREKISRSSKHYCEQCSSVIWGVLQSWYRCEACGFCCHEKCLNLITRICAGVKVLENPIYIMSICPEKGLGSQNYKCADCRAEIAFKTGHTEPRQCDYTGMYLCEACHWNDTMVVPARVLHNWDLEPRRVCRASKQFLKLMNSKPAIRIQDINPMLFSYVEELNEVKKLREEILIMKKYFLSCQEALNSKLLLQLKDRQHFVENSDLYSLQDLVDIAYDVLLPELAKIHTSFAQHIKTDCHLCQAKGYICEICDQSEVLFPFDNHAIVCPQCSTVVHRHCLVRRNNICPKCDRLTQRGSQPLKPQETVGDNDS